MKRYGCFIAGFAAMALVSAPVLAQTNPDTEHQSSGMASENGADPAAGVQKQQSGGTAGAEPQQYGGAQKQHTQGTAGYQPQQYGSDWAHTRNQPTGQ
jgi:hypothetical protein